LLLLAAPPPRLRLALPACLNAVLSVLPLDAPDQPVFRADGVLAQAPAGAVQPLPGLVNARGVAHAWTSCQYGATPQPLPAGRHRRPGASEPPGCLAGADRPEQDVLLGPPGGAAVGPAHLGADQRDQRLVERLVHRPVPLAPCPASACGAPLPHPGSEPHPGLYPSATSRSPPSPAQSNARQTSG